MEITLLGFSKYIKEHTLGEKGSLLTWKSPGVMLIILEIDKVELSILKIQFFPNILSSSIIQPYC